MSWRDEFLNEICSDLPLDLMTFHRIIKDRLPEHIYRFRSPSQYNFDALRDGYEYLSYPDEYNDPFDARLFFKNEEVRRYAFNSVIWDGLGEQNKILFFKLSNNNEPDLDGDYISEQIKRFSILRYGRVVSKFKRLSKEIELLQSRVPSSMLEDMNDFLRSDILFCSFTTNKYNELMWSHYSDSHKGFCLEYEEPAFNPDLGSMFMPCSYREHPLDVTKHIKASMPSGNGSAKAVIGSAIVKSKAWSYEDEWRYCLIGESEMRETKEFKVKRVYVGCNASLENISKLSKICSKKSIPLIKMKRSANRFSVTEGDFA